MTVRSYAPGMAGAIERRRWSAACPGPARGTADAALAHAHRHVHRAALEAKLLAQPPLDEPPVAGFEEPGGEKHEMRRADPHLRREEDLGQPPAARRRRGR